MNTIQTTTTAKLFFIASVGVVIAAVLAIITMPTYASAADFAYVDSNGDVRLVSASDWMTAIAVAPNIHIHSGVLVLTTAQDSEVVGDNVSAF